MIQRTMIKFSKIKSFLTKLPNKNLLTLGIIGIIAAAIPLTQIVLNQSTNYQQHAMYDGGGGGNGGGCTPSSKSYCSNYRFYTTVTDASCNITTKSFQACDLCDYHGTNTLTLDQCNTATHQTCTAVKNSCTGQTTLANCLYKPLSCGFIQTYGGTCTANNQCETGYCNSGVCLDPPCNPIPTYTPACSNGQQCVRTSTACSTYSAIGDCAPPAEGYCGYTAHAKEGASCTINKCDTGLYCNASHICQKNPTAPNTNTRCGANKIGYCTWANPPAIPKATCGPNAHSIYSAATDCNPLVFGDYMCCVVNTTTSTSCASDNDCPSTYSCSPTQHQCLQATASSKSVDACADVTAGNGMYCGGTSGNTGDPSTLYNCQNGQISGTPQKCSNGCQVASNPNPDYCKSDSTGSNTGGTTSGSNTGGTTTGGNTGGNTGGTSSNPTSAPKPTFTPTPTPTPGAGSGGIGGQAYLNLAVQLTGIGANGNVHPAHSTRLAHIQIYKKGDNPSQPNILPVANLKNIILTYNATSGYFLNPKIDLGKNFATGDYQILVKVPGALRRTVVDKQQNNVFTITVGQTTILPSINLIAGDVVPLYNVTDIADFYAIVECYQNFADTAFCTAGKSLVDLNDDGIVDGIDLNIWLLGMNTLLQADNASGNGNGVVGD